MTTLKINGKLKRNSLTLPPFVDDGPTDEKARRKMMLL